MREQQVAALLEGVGLLGAGVDPDHPPPHGGRAPVQHTSEGEGTLEVAIDGRAREPIAVRSPGLYELALHERHGEHGLVLDPSPGVRVWSISFAAGVP